MNATPSGPCRVPDVAGNAQPPLTAATVGSSADHASRPTGMERVPSETLS